MCGQAYLTSARIAEAVGPCPGYAVNEEPFLDVILMHGNAVQRDRQQARAGAICSKPRRIAGTTRTTLGERAGFRNAQTTVIAPTGTIGFMMDCDTTGIEPDLALVKYKKLVGGGVIKIVNNTVPQALIKLGYTPEQVEMIVTHIDSTGTIEGAPGLKDEHLPVFDCSFRPQNGKRSIHYMGHVKMMARGAAVHFRRDFEDHQHAGRVHCGRDHGRLHRELAAGAEGGGDLSRQFQACAAAELGHGQRREEGDGGGAAPAQQVRGEDRVPAGAAQAAGRAAIDHAQVFDRRPRRLHHGGHVRRRNAGRGVHLHGEGRVDHLAG